MLNVACQLLPGVDWCLVQLSNHQQIPLGTKIPNGFSFSVQNDVWSDECSGPLDAKGGPCLTIAQRKSLWQAIRLTRLGDPHHAELALLRTFLRP
jgi:hypothetical protein